VNTEGTLADVMGGDMIKGKIYFKNWKEYGKREKGICKA
jgi:hypothetical protein